MRAWSMTATGSQLARGAGERRVSIEGGQGVVGAMRVAVGAAGVVGERKGRLDGKAGKRTGMANWGWRVVQG